MYAWGKQTIHKIQQHMKFQASGPHLDKERLPHCVPVTQLGHYFNCLIVLFSTKITITDK